MRHIGREHGHAKAYDLTRLQGHPRPIPRLQSIDKVATCPGKRLNGLLDGDHVVDMGRSHIDNERSRRVGLWIAALPARPFKRGVRNLIPHIQRGGQIRRNAISVMPGKQRQPGNGFRVRPQGRPKVDPRQFVECGGHAGIGGERISCHAHAHAAVHIHMPGRHGVGDPTRNVGRIEQYWFLQFTPSQGRVPFRLIGRQVDLAHAGVLDNYLHRCICTTRYIVARSDRQQRHDGYDGNIERVTHTLSHTAGDPQTGETPGALTERNCSELLAAYTGLRQQIIHHREQSLSVLSCGVVMRGTHGDLALVLAEQGNAANTG